MEPEKENMREKLSIHSNYSELISRLTTSEDLPVVMKDNKYPTERISVLLFSSAMVVGGVNSFFVKLVIKNFGEDFDNISFIFWRSIFLILIPLYFIKHNNVPLKDPRTVQNKFWFGMRTLGQLFSALSYNKCLSYLRVSTANCIYSMNPVVVVLFSTFLLKEKFYVRYIVGILLCVFGTLLILMNDKKAPQVPNELSENINLDTHLETGKDSGNGTLLNLINGGFYGFINLILAAMIIVSSKVLANEKVDTINQMFYLGLINVIFISPFLLIFEYIQTNIIFILCGGTNGILLIINQYLIIKSLEVLDLNKTTSLVYISTIVVFILGGTILGESVYLTDIMGSLIILGYNLYNSMFPLKS